MDRIPFTGMRARASESFKGVVYLDLVSLPTDRGYHSEIVKGGSFADAAGKGAAMGPHF
jgi:hypothetical protein